MIRASTDGNKINHSAIFILAKELYFKRAVFLVCQLLETKLITRKKKYSDNLLFLLFLIVLGVPGPSALSYLVHVKPNKVGSLWPFSGQQVLPTHDSDMMTF